jgi:hypothetical protein
MLCLALVLLVAQPVPPGPPPTGVQRLGPAEAPAGWRDHFDELWKARDQPGAEKEIEQVLLQHLVAHDLKMADRAQICEKCDEYAEETWSHGKVTRGPA